jgi:hypothetical protein
MNYTQGQDNLRCCTRITGDHLRVFAYSWGSTKLAAEILDEYDKGTLHADAKRAKRWLLFSDPERKRNPCHGRKPLSGRPAVLPDCSKNQGMAKD